MQNITNLIPIWKTNDLMPRTKNCSIDHVQYFLRNRKPIPFATAKAPSLPVVEKNLQFILVPEAGFATEGWVIGIQTAQEEFKHLIFC